MSATTALGGRIGRHAAVYASGLLVTILLGIANVVVMTRFLAPSEFGKLAMLLFFAELCAVVYNLGSMQGGITLAFGAAMSDADEVANDERAGRPDSAALGTTLLLTTGIGALGLMAALPLSGSIADLLLGDANSGDLVLAASAIALFTALWRVLTVVPYRERRPLAFVVVSNARPALMTLGAVPLLVAGLGIEGAMLGALAGSALAMGLALALTSGSYGFHPTWSHTVRIFSAGAALVPAIIALWLLRNAEVYLLAQLASVRDAGIFRVASRAGALMYFPVSAILMAWGAFRRDPIHRAAEQERGSVAAVGSLVATYFAFATLWIELGLAVGADALVLIAPSEYASAASLIPLVGLGLLLHGWFLVVYRLGRYTRRRLTYNLIVVGELVAFLALCALLIPTLKGTGAALALVAAPAAAGSCAFVLARRAAAHPPLQYRRIGAAVGVAAGLYALDRLVAPASGAAGASAAVGAFMAYPAVLLGLGAISPRERRQLVAAGRRLLPLGREDRPVHERIAALSSADRAALYEVIVRDGALTDLAADSGLDVETVRLRFLAVLRRTADLDVAQRPGDDLLATYLLRHGSPATRDGMTASLWAAGVDPFEADTLTRTLTALRRDTRRRRLAR